MDIIISVNAFFKVKIYEILSSEVLKENSRTYILLKWKGFKFKISKVRVAGKVLEIRNRGDFWDCTISDNTGNIIMREWNKQGNMLSELHIQDTIDVFALIREFKNIPYLVPTIITKITIEALKKRDDEIKLAREAIIRQSSYHHNPQNQKPSSSR